MKNIEGVSQEVVSYDNPGLQPDVSQADTAIAPQGGVDTELSLSGRFRENVSYMMTVATGSLALVTLLATANMMAKENDTTVSQARIEAARRENERLAAQRRAAEERVREMKAAREAARNAKRP